MGRSIFLALALLVGLGGLSLAPRSALAQDRILALAFIPNNLYPEDRATFSARRQALQAQLSALQASAATFNAESAESQTDAEYNALAARRTAYIAAADAFNADLAALATAATARAALPVFHVFARGEFYFVTKDGHRVSGAEAATIPIDGGTRAVTGPGGRIQLLLPDETVFTMGADSDMVLDDFVYDPATAATATMARLAKGTFRFVTGKTARQNPEHMKIKVPVGVIGDRGTDIEVSVGADGGGYVRLRSGSATLTPTDGSAVVVIETGEMISFGATGTISEPRPFKGDDAVFDRLAAPGA